jgi:hypothetical protein
MFDERIKKVIKRIYEFDFSKSELIDGNEIITTDTTSEFIMTFRKRDLDSGIIVTPSGYTKGLVYKSTNNGEFYNNPSWIPDIVSFAMNIYGLKKGNFYKITVIGRDTGSNTVITNDRRLTINNEEKEVLIDHNFKGVSENKEIYGLFRASKNETNLFFKIGKIYINNIIIDEVEIVTEEKSEEVEVKDIFDDGKVKMVAYGIFTTEPLTDDSYKGRYVPMTRYSGKGINLYFDKNTNEYLIERDNIEDTIEESFTNINYLIDLNFNKVANKKQFSQYNISEVSPDISPNTLKQGYIKFEFVDDSGKNVRYVNSSGRIYIRISKIF